MSYDVLSLTTGELADLGNAPAVVIPPYLLETKQTSLLRVISIYAKRGDSRGQVRLLYMNAPALAIWKEMGQIGKHHWTSSASAINRPIGLWSSLLGIGSPHRLPVHSCPVTLAGALPIMVKLGRMATLYFCLNLTYDS